MVVTFFFNASVFLFTCVLLMWWPSQRALVDSVLSYLHWRCLRRLLFYDFPFACFVLSCLLDVCCLFPVSSSVSYSPACFRFWFSVFMLFSVS